MLTMQRLVLMILPSLPQTSDPAPQAGDTYLVQVAGRASQYHLEGNLGIFVQNAAVECVDTSS